MVASSQSSTAAMHPVLVSTIMLPMRKSLWTIDVADSGGRRASSQSSSGANDFGTAPSSAVRRAHPPHLPSVDPAGFAEVVEPHLEPVHGVQRGESVHQ